MNEQRRARAAFYLLAYAADPSSTLDRLNFHRHLFVTGRYEGDAPTNVEWHLRERQQWQTFQRAMISQGSN